jgi:hypothetical protein
MKIVSNERDNVHYITATGTGTIIFACEEGDWEFYFAATKNGQVVGIKGPDVKQAFITARMGGDDD